MQGIVRHGIREIDLGSFIFERNCLYTHFSSSSRQLLVGWNMTPADAVKQHIVDRIRRPGSPQYRLEASASSACCQPTATRRSGCNLKTRSSLSVHPSWFCQLLLLVHARQVFGVEISSCGMISYGAASCGTTLCRKSLTEITFHGTTSGVHVLKTIAAEYAIGGKRPAMGRQITPKRWLEELRWDFDERLLILLLEIERTTQQVPTPWQPARRLCRPLAGEYLAEDNVSDWKYIYDSHVREESG